MKKRIMIISFVFLACVAMAGEIYKWTDANGVVHYSSVPANQDAQIVSLPNSAPVTVLPPAVSNKNTPTQSSGTPQPTEEETQHALELQKETQAFCEQSKQNLSTLQETGRRVYTVSPSGQYHYYNDQERQQEIEKMQQSIKLYCKP